MLAAALWALAPAASAQFDVLPWTFTPGAAGSSGVVSASTMVVVGSFQLEPCIDGAAATFSAVAPYAGTVSARVHFTSSNAPDQDQPIYLVGGVAVGIGGGCADCEIAFSVGAGEVFGFGVSSVDCLFAPGVLAVTDFHFLPAPASASLGRAAAFDGFGSALALAGDLDGDGAPEVLAGSPRADEAAGPDSGRAAVLSAATGLELTAFGGAAQGDLYGSAVAGAGDVDQDGVPDLLLGAPRGDGLALDAGTVELRSGATGALLLLSSGSSPGDGFGTALAGGFDFDGDLVPDFAVGAPTAGGAPAFPGSVAVLSGATGQVLLQVLGSAASSGLGSALAAAGDVDGDGSVDLAYGTPFATGPGPSPGLVRVASGAGGGELLLLLGAVDSEGFGSAVAGIGDADGDGRGDLAVGAPFTAIYAGRVELFSGASGETLAAGTEGVQVGQSVGAALAPAGDFDGDGRSDYLAGAPATGVTTPEPRTGTVRLVSGRTGAVQQVFPAFAGADGFGSAVAYLGDVDGDGRDDFAAGAPLSDLHADDGGAAWRLAPRPLWSDLGLALDGANGPPALIGSGVLAPGTIAKLAWSNALPDSLGVLVVGLSRADLAILGGTLVPTADFAALVPMSQNGDGALAGPLSAATPAGLPFYAQLLVADKAALHGAAFSNAVRGITQ